MFFNTFGWEIVGLLVVMASSVRPVGRRDVWRWFCFYQLLEATGSCLSVSQLRRHLMVWAIFAPRFAFASVFFTIVMGGWVVAAIGVPELRYRSCRREDLEHARMD